MLKKEAEEFNDKLDQHVVKTAPQPPEYNLT
jgi:hypothetical protein